MQKKVLFYYNICRPINITIIITNDIITTTLSKCIGHLQAILKLRVFLGSLTVLLFYCDFIILVFVLLVVVLRGVLGIFYPLLLLFSVICWVTVLTFCMALLGTVMCVLDYVACLVGINLG